MTIAPRLRRTAALTAVVLLVSFATTVATAQPSEHTPQRVTQPAASAVHNGCSKSKIDVPSCGVLWGMFRPPVKDTPYWQPHYGQFERAIGRRFDIVKDYTDWRAGDTFPNRVFTKLGRDHIVYISWNAIDYKTQSKIQYAAIASGKYDRSVILPEARRLKHYHHRIIIDFNHEFDSQAQAGKGSPRQYVAAYRHIHQVMARAGVHNVIWSWVSTGYLPHKSYIRRSYPGRKYVDWVGYDPYNFAECLHGSWHSSYQTFHPFYRWSAKQPGMRNKPLVISEYASAPGYRIKHWYGSIADTLRRLPRIKAAIQFSAPSEVPCDVTLEDSKQGLAGFKASANDPYVLGERG